MKKIKLNIIFVLIIISGINCKESVNQKNIANGSKNSNETKITKSYWSEKYAIDEFGDTTKTKYIISFAEGKFSNSATSDSYLWVQIALEKDFAVIFLHEYDRSNPAEGFKANIKMKNYNGDLLEIAGNEDWLEHSAGIYIMDKGPNANYFKMFKEFLQKNNDVRVVITKGYSSIYKFTIQTAGFTEAISKL